MYARCLIFGAIALFFYMLFGHDARDVPQNDVFVLRVSLTAL